MVLVEVARWAEKDKAQKAWGIAAMSPHFSPLPLASTCQVPKHSPQVPQSLPPVFAYAALCQASSMTWESNVM